MNFRELFSSWIKQEEWFNGCVLFWKIISLSALLTSATDNNKAPQLWNYALLTVRLKKKYKFALVRIISYRRYRRIETIFLDDLTQSIRPERVSQERTHPRIKRSFVYPRLFAFPPSTVNYSSRSTAMERYPPSSW